MKKEELIEIINGCGQCTCFLICTLYIFMHSRKHILKNDLSQARCGCPQILCLPLILLCIIFIIFACNENVIEQSHQQVEQMKRCLGTNKVPMTHYGGRLEMNKIVNNRQECSSQLYQILKNQQLGLKQKKEINTNNEININHQICWKQLMGVRKIGNFLIQIQIQIYLMLLNRTTPNSPKLERVSRLRQEQCQAESKPNSC